MGGVRENYIQDGLVFQLDGIDKGADSTAWTDLVGGVSFPYTEHSTVNNDSIAMDGGGVLTASEQIVYNYQTGTIEVTFYVQDVNAGIIFYSGQPQGLSLVIAGAGYTYAIGTSRLAPKNQYDTSKPSGKVILSASYNIFMLNGSIPQSTKSTNGWDATSDTTIGGRIANGNPYLKACTIYAIRIYNRQLTADEMLHNQQIDNVRFNLGLDL